MHICCLSSFLLSISFNLLTSIKKSECQLILTKTDSQQRILLHHAAQASVEMFNTVIRYCVPNLATQDKYGNTPLHVAATSRGARVKVLIVKGPVSEAVYVYLCNIKMNVSDLDLSIILRNVRLKLFFPDQFYLFPSQIQFCYIVGEVRVESRKHSCSEDCNKSIDPFEDFSKKILTGRKKDRRSIVKFEKSWVINVSCEQHDFLLTLEIPILSIYLFNVVESGHKNGIIKDSTTPQSQMDQIGSERTVISADFF